MPLDFSELVNTSESLQPGSSEVPQGFQLFSVNGGSVSQEVCELWLKQPLNTGVTSWAGCV